MRLSKAIVSILCLWFSATACAPFQTETTPENLRSTVGQPIDLTELNCSQNELERGGTRRLNHREFSNIIKDLIGNYTIAADGLPRDLKNGKDYDTDGSALHILDLEADKYYIALDTILEQAFAGTNRPNFVSCNLDAAADGVSPSQCFQNSLRVLMRRAIRKPFSTTQMNRIVEAAAGEATPRNQLKLATQIVLMSPDFLFVNSAPMRDPNQLHTLNNFELAERLALLLWSSVPDEQLASAAANNQLATQQQLTAQITRMVADPKFDNFYDGFIKLWLNQDRLAIITRDQGRFPDFSQTLLNDMMTETRMFLRHVVSENRPMDEILTANYTFANSRLANFYGISGVTGDNFRQVTLPANRRQGLLTQPGIMTVTGKDADTSPVRRGLWILRKVTCDEPPPPPPNIPELIDSPPGQEEMTIKERLEIHRQNPVCAGCHKQMDPIGIGLENFDGFGKFRTSYGENPVDPSEALNGIAFNTPTELVNAISAQKRFQLCVANQMTSYAIGRITDKEDECFANNMAFRASQKNGTFVDLIIELVKSDIFLKEQGE